MVQVRSIGLRRSNNSNSPATETSYRSLLQVNMSLLDRLHKQEHVCRALEDKIGNIDTKMGNVADEHLKRLGNKSVNWLTLWLMKASS